MDATELQPDAGKIPARKGGDTPKTRLLTLDSLDKRTKAAQRVQELADRLLAERGGEAAGELRRAITRDVAVLSAMIEDLAARWLLGEPVEPAAIATLVNTRRREAELVGVDPVPRDVTPSLNEYLRGKGAAATAGAAVG